MKNASLTNCEKYNKIKNLAHEKREAAKTAIENRLEIWAKAEWIDDTKAVFQIVKRFRKEYIQNDSHERDWLENWECGMCQMIDIQDENVCSLLPYLLTAYVYNFPRNQFVSVF